MPHVRVPPNHGLSDIIAAYFPDGYRGHAVDVGASDGVSVNSTYGLEKTRGWTVLSVEPNPEFWPALTTERAFVERCACADYVGTATMHVNADIPEAYSTIGSRPGVESGYALWNEIEVRVDTLERLLEKWQFPKLDVLCVDTEGTELAVLQGLDLAKWKPIVVVTECWQPTGPIDGYLEALGYRKHPRIQVQTFNDLFWLDRK